LERGRLDKDLAVQLIIESDKYGLNELEKNRLLEMVYYHLNMRPNENIKIKHDPRYFNTERNK